MLHRNILPRKVRLILFDDYELHYHVFDQTLDTNGWVSRLPAQELVNEDPKEMKAKWAGIKSVHSNCKQDEMGENLLPSPPLTPEGLRSKIRN